MHYALPEKSKYPLETEEQIKLANDYFGKYIDRFHPVERATIAGNIEKRASAMGMYLDSGWVQNYARRTEYSPDFDLHMKMRKEACAGQKIEFKGAGIVDACELLDKLASHKDQYKPKDMIYALAQFDKAAGLESKYDHHMRDPIFTVFGSASRPGFDMKKLATGISETELKKAASNESFIKKIASAFGENFSRDFKGDPIALFQSMPAPEKELITGFAKGK